jgi:hypothetical protein
MLHHLHLPAQKEIGFLPGLRIYWLFCFQLFTSEALGMHATSAAEIFSFSSFFMQVLNISS